MRSPRLIALALLVPLSTGLSCASTEYFPEGSGVPTDRASGAVPAGSLGACKRPGTKRPVLVSQQLWDDIKPCAPSTPVGWVRLGYGRAVPNDAEADKQAEVLLQSVRDAQKPETGNSQFSATLRSLRTQALKDEALRDRVSRDPVQQTCDPGYLLSTMAKERAKLEQGRPCAAEVYDPKQRTEVCLFDTGRAEASWLGASWDCLTHTGAVGQEESCHRLCGYDDYCAQQVSCSASDVDLVLCSLGVCLPEARAGFYGR